MSRAAIERTLIALRNAEEYLEELTHWEFACQHASRTRCCNSIANMEYTVHKLSAELQELTDKEAVWRTTL